MKRSPSVFGPRICCNSEVISPRRKVFSKNETNARKEPFKNFLQLAINNKFVYRHRTLTGGGIKSIDYLNILHIYKSNIYQPCIPHREKEHVATLNFDL